MRERAFAVYLNTFAAETRRAREARGFSRKELARHAGLHENTICAIEREERDLSCITQTRLLAALGCEGLDVGKEGVRIVLGTKPHPPRRSPLLEKPAAAVIGSMGASIRVRRTEFGLSLEDLSRKAGIHRNTVWNFERGLVVPNGYSVFALFRALELPTAQPEILDR